MRLVHFHYQDRAQSALICSKYIRFEASRGLMHVSYCNAEPVAEVPLCRTW